MSTREFMASMMCIALRNEIGNKMKTILNPPINKLRCGRICGSCTCRHTKIKRALAAPMHEPLLTYLKTTFIQSATMRILASGIRYEPIAFEKKNEKRLVIQTQQHQTVSQDGCCDAATTIYYSSEITHVLNHREARRQLSSRKVIESCFK
jgi:hypothetical protein